MRQAAEVGLFRKARGVDDLFDDLGSRHVAGQAGLTRGAERTRHTATGL